MVLTVGYPCLENHETWGTPRLGGLSTKNDGVRDLGHLPAELHNCGRFLSCFETWTFAAQRNRHK